MSLRNLLPAMMRLPHFLVLGTQKGGTTSLQKLLEQHPGVYLPPCKEVHYFSLHAYEPPSWYADHYRKAKRGQQRGDITPFYLFHQDVPARIKALIPQVRMIALLRDPVERTLSQFFHARRQGFENLDLESALAAESERIASGSLFSYQKHSYMARSRYKEQLDRYENLFSREQILIMKSEDLFYNTEEAWEKIQTFLKLKRIPMPIKLPKENSGNNEARYINPRVRTKLRESLADTLNSMSKEYGISWERY